MYYENLYLHKRNVKRLIDIFYLENTFKEGRSRLLGQNFQDFFPKFVKIFSSNSIRSNSDLCKIELLENFEKEDSKANHFIIRRHVVDVTSIRITCITIKSLFRDSYRSHFRALG